MNQELVSVIKTQIYGILDDYMTYETTGKDFVERLENVVDRDVEEKPTREVPLDMELYTKFVHHLTEHIMSGVEVK